MPSSTATKMMLRRWGLISALGDSLSGTVSVVVVLVILPSLDTCSPDLSLDRLGKLRDPGRIAARECAPTSVDDSIVGEPTRTPALEGASDLGCYALVGGRDTHWAE